MLRLEAEFAAQGHGGLVRFFGNHDDLWEQPAQVESHLRSFFGDLEVRETLLLPFTDVGKPIGEMLFAHGHQGTTESDKWGRWARLPVRYFWRRIQRKAGISATTPSSDYRLRGKHDRALFEWVREQDGETPLVLVTGHTHRPVFSLPDPPARTPEVITSEQEAARAAGNGELVTLLRAELEHACAIPRDKNNIALTVDPPCYFNTGCCSFPDGDVTGLEIADGEIRLVRWPYDEEKPQRRQLGCRPLRDVFAQVGSFVGEPEILEHTPLA